jgi:large subunit ribosomal protein L4e
MLAAARPLVTVHKLDGTSDAKKPETVKLPNVLLAPIRNDIVAFVHSNMNKNRRQAYGVGEKSGMQHSAESWGTGRAVARIPRVSGGGTSRAGQAAFGNMCRKGRMAAPTKIWRRWHRKINQNQKRYAVASALAASAIPSLVLARGHHVEEVPELPLVVSDEVESLKKTRDAKKLLEGVYAYSDVQKAKESRKLRAGKGKMRNRRHVQRRGPLVVFNEDKGVSRAFRNLPGVELAHVDRLNLLQLAPGGHLGRFIVWTKSAFQRLDQVWGSQTRVSVQKKGYTLPRAGMIQSDLTRLINSDEIQSKVRPAIKQVKRARQKKNPLKNLGVMITLNPYALALRRSALLTEQRRQTARANVLAARKAAPAKKAAAPAKKAAAPAKKAAAPAKKAPKKAAGAALEKKEEKNKK